MDKNLKGVMDAWSKAAIILGHDPDAVVLCPECEIGYLKCKDEVFKSKDKVDRYMICNNCGRCNVLTMNNNE